MLKLLNHVIGEPSSFSCLFLEIIVVEFEYFIGVFLDIFEKV